MNIYDVMFMFSQVSSYHISKSSDGCGYAICHKTWNNFQGHSNCAQGKCGHNSYDKMSLYDGAKTGV